MWLANNWRNLIWFALVLCVVQLAYSARDYRDRADKAESALKSAKETITDMQTRQRDAAALDAKYTKELADAKAKLDDLQLCVRSGKCGLRVNASCAKSDISAASSLDDASSPGLTESAQRDYFTLRERIETVTKQLTGLQAYVREQCLN